MKKRICCGTAVGHSPTKYYRAAEMARDGEIDLSYVPTAEMLADCFTKPLTTPAVLKQSALMAMIGIEVGNGLGHGLGNGFGNDLGNGLGYGVGNGVGNGLGTVGNGPGNGIGNDMEMTSAMPSKSK
jgi:hypothetical protein